MASSLVAVVLIASPVPVAAGDIVGPPATIQMVQVASNDVAIDLATASSAATNYQDEPTQEAPAAGAGTKEEARSDQSDRDKRDTEEASKSFMGISFGVGVAFTLDWGGQSRVEDAELVEGIVRVTDSQDGEARVLLEVHHFWPLGTKNRDEALYGVGPFVSVQPGSDDVIDSLGIGVMVGMRRSAKSRESLNIGLGLIVDPNSQLLGDGIVANQPLPAGETSIRYKTEYETGFMLMASFSF